MDSDKNNDEIQNKNIKNNLNKNGVKNIRKEKSKMNTEIKPANSSNPESEEDDQNLPKCASVPSGSGGSSIKVTIKKTRSCSSSSSRESTQSFKVVRSVPPVSENEMDTKEDNISNKEPSDDGKDENAKIEESEKESEEESQHFSDDIEGIEISSDDSQDSYEEKKSPSVPVKAENKDETNSSFNSVVKLKSEEVPQNAPVVMKEECKIKIKSLKEELVKEANMESDIVVLNDDDDNYSAQVSEPQNGVEKKEIKQPIKEQKFKVNVRSFNDLAAPHTVKLINLPPAQIDGPNFLSQNGAPFPPPYMACEVCGMQFDSSELLSDHKIAMKHYKCSFKECEHLVITNQQEFLDHQRLIHNIMPSPVQQLAHQVQRLPSMGFDQQLQSGVPPLPENLPHPPPNMYSQSLRMPNQPVPMQRPMRPMMRHMPPHMMPTRGRSAPRGTRGRGVSMGMMPRGGSIKRPISTPLRGTPPPKRAATDRNAYTNNMNKTPQVIKSLSESLTKSLANKSAATPSQQDVVNLFSKRGLTISTVDTVNNISIPAGLSLNSAVSIIPTSPLKSVDTVDLTGPDKPREKKFFPCEVCSKTYLSIETLCDHVNTVHKTLPTPFKCNLCKQSFLSGTILNHHKTSFHRLEVNSNIPLIIPIFDIDKPSTVAKMQSMGISSYMPVTQLDNQNSHYGVPIMSTSRPGSLDGLKYTDFFHLGCVRKI